MNPPAAQDALIERSRRLGRWPNWVYFTRIDSTNAVARRVAADFRRDDRRPVPAVFQAATQTAGRGRGRNRWESPPGTGVYVSMLLPAVAASELPRLPLLVAVGLARGLAEAMGRPLGLKWPNDVLVEGRKLCGILIEVVPTGAGEPAAVIGFGVNYAQSEAELPVPHATSVRLAAGAAFEDLERRGGADGLAERLVTAIDAELDRLGDPAGAAETVQAYGSLSLHELGDKLRCRTPEGELKGVFRGFDRRGFLRLDVDGEVKTLAAGELAADG